MADEVKSEVNEVEDDCIVFNEEPKTQKIKIKNGEGKLTTYLLREMMGPDVAKWQEFDAGRIKVTRNRIDMAPDAFKEYSATLINLCMFDESDTKVTKAQVLKWPSTTINGIFDICQTMNGLNAEGRDAAKKA